MDHDFHSEQSPLPYNLTHNSSDTEDSEEDFYPAQQSQAEFFPGNLNGTVVSSITPGSYSYPFNQNGPWDGKLLRFKYGLVLTCSPRIRILAYPTIRSEHPQRSVAVLSSTTHSLKWCALIYIFINWGCSMIDKSSPCLQCLCTGFPRPLTHSWSSP